MIKGLTDHFSSFFESLGISKAEAVEPVVEPVAEAALASARPPAPTPAASGATAAKTAAVELVAAAKTAAAASGAPAKAKEAAASLQSVVAPPRAVVAPETSEPPAEAPPVSVTNPVTTLVTIPAKPYDESIVLLEINGELQKEDINIYIEYLKGILNTTNFTVELFEIKTPNNEKITPGLLTGGGDIIKNVLKIKGTISEEQVPLLTSENIGEKKPTLLEKVESEEDASKYLIDQGIPKETKPTIIHDSRPKSSTSITETQPARESVITTSADNVVSNILNTDITDIDITNSSNVGLYMALMGLGTAVTFLIL